MKFLGRFIKFITMAFGVVFLATIAISIVAALQYNQKEEKRANDESEKLAELAARSCKTCVYDQSDSMATVVAHEMVSRQLKDPKSAIWDGQRSWTDLPKVRVTRTADGGIRAICGTVNAKNGFGGYSGDQFYLVSLEYNFIKVGVSDDEFKTFCM